jgi:LmbE family N-acetylglucosaminyl deacetylase
LAPHMDDEVIGCGGTLYKHIRNGAEVTVVYMTDGRYGNSTLQNLAGEERRRREAEIVETRKREARQAMKILGVKEGIFLDVENDTLASTDEIQNKLRQILDSIQPDLVYLPFFLEEHPDHRAVSQILFDATEGTPFQFDCSGYEVWTPLFPNCFVDINDAVEMKKQALQQYQSQLADKDYIHASLGLNAYRSIALEAEKGFVEAFYMAPLRDYRELYGSYCKFGVS